MEFKKCFKIAAVDCCFKRVKIGGSWCRNQVASAALPCPADVAQAACQSSQQSSWAVHFQERKKREKKKRQTNKK